MRISFTGHSSILSGERVKEIVKEQLRENITASEHIICYLGGYGDFDECCALACRELKKEYPTIKLIYVAPYLTLSEQKKIKQMERAGFYDASIYPPIENTPNKFAIIKRNEWMIENADLVIAYVNRSYGGAYKALEIAKRKKKRIINIFNLI